MPEQAAATALFLMASKARPQKLEPTLRNAQRTTTKNG